jgi:pimeloyl-ACP methyl ester carboxylesterase
LDVFLGNPEEAAMSKRSAYSACVSIVLLVTLVKILPVCAQTKPVVVSTIPADMANNVSPDIVSFTITFSKPMDTRYGLPLTNGWPGGTTPSWSSDKKTVTYSRPPATIQAGTTITIYLNFYSSLPQSVIFRDTEGNILDPYKFVFTIAGGQSGLSRILASPSKGFSWPYYLYIPPNIRGPAVLLVQPNNTGSVDDNPAVHETAARTLIEGSRWWADELGTPYLIPTFPRPASLPVGYTHALERDALLTKVPGYERIDLQLIAMIEDARAVLSAKGINVASKVFMEGSSASGSFVSRFTMLHPDRVNAASIGCPGFGPIVPVSSWNGQNLPYPEGISDLKDLVGSPFDSASFRTVPLQVWVGDEDYNVDPWWNPADATVARVIAAFGGRHLYSRWPRYEAAYGSVTSLAQFVVFPGMGHQMAPWSYLREFFENNRTSPQPPSPKPLQFKIYFPHVASGGLWETEIALVNTIAGGVGIRGQLQAFRASGGSPLQSLPIEIPAGGRKEITVGTSFQNPGEVAYLIFLADSGFLAGYTRFNQPGNRVSLPAASGVQEGWFPKMEQDGWTGLAFVNISEGDASVTLAALDENGNKIAEERLQVGSGVKTVGMVGQIFHGDLSRARYFSFSSDKLVLAFSVSGSADGQMLDGLPSLAWYIR